MNILHLFKNTNEKFYKPYIKFINDNFSTEEHYFMIEKYIEGAKVEGIDNNVELISKANYLKLIKKMYHSDRIILHALMSPRIVLILFFQPWLLKKCYWVAWGGDLYQWKKKIEGSIFKRIRGRVRNNIALWIRKNIKYFVGIFPPDIDYFKNEFHTEAETFYASYAGNLYNPLYRKEIIKYSIEEKVEKNDCINILIGNSSTKILNHFDVLKNIEKFRKENIKIFIPLSYGDKIYGDKVQKEANRIFGTKSICIREMMSIDKYMDLLRSIDIAIFNTKRQIGLGNISPMLYMEKKIYMPKNSTMYDFYKSQQIDIWDYSEIADFDYGKFIKPLRYKGGQKYLQDNELNLEHKLQMWSKVFETPLK